MLPYKEKKALLAEVCIEQAGTDYCTETVVQGMAAVSMSETLFARAKGFRADATADAPGWESWNFGAMQCGAKADPQGQCPERCFPHKDSSPVTGGYIGCFRKYDSEREGASAFVKLLLTSKSRQKPSAVIDGQSFVIRSALATGDVWSLSEAMWLAGYYEGTGGTPYKRVVNHTKLMTRQFNSLETYTGEPSQWVLVVPPEPSNPLGTGAAIGSGSALVVVCIAAAIKQRFFSLVHQTVIITVSRKVHHERPKLYRLPHQPDA